MKLGPFALLRTVRNDYPMAAVTVQRKHLALLAAAAYLASLALPAYVTLPPDQYSKSVYGYEILLTGWIASAAGDIRWFANLLFFYVLLWRGALGRRVVIPKVIAVLLSLVAFSMLMPPVPGMFDKMRFTIGAFVWGASLLLAAALCFQQPSKPIPPS